MKLRRIIAPAVLTAAASALLVPTPASADPTYLQCEPGNLQANCGLIGPATSERWTFNGVAYSYGNDQADIFPNCGAQGAVWRVSVNFLDGSGTAQTQIASGNCQRVSP